MPATTAAASIILAGVLLASCSSCTTTGPEPQHAPLKQAPVQQAHVKRQSRNVAVELLNLYEEYREFLAVAGPDPHEFQTAQSALAIIEDRVVIDATAKEGVERLRQDLADIGAVHLAAAQNLISCQFPILAIPQLQELESLKFARPSYVTTH